MTIDVAVVGAGISGLTAAYRLRQRLGPDARIDVYEADERVGGILKTVDVGSPGADPIGIDVGAEAFIVRRPEALGLVTADRPCSTARTIAARAESRPDTARRGLAILESA
ncbi:FAD-dependent oxidoreductase, partial [Gordonia aichiensis]